MKFKRNKETGIVETFENGKKVGEIVTMGDLILGNEPGQEVFNGKENSKRKGHK